MALPDLPPDVMVAAFRTVRADLMALDVAGDYKTSIRSLLTYMERQWMVKVGPEALSVHAASLEETTNNRQESYNARLNRYGLKVGIVVDKRHTK